MNWILSATLLAYVVTGVSSSPRTRHRRQSNVENVHLYPFKELCAEKLNVNVSAIHNATTTGVPSAILCSYYVLQCQTASGNVSRYLEQCGIGMWWSFNMGTCQVPSLANRQDCVNTICSWGMEGMLVMDPRACFGYYECRGWSAFYEFCEEGGFNPAIQNCAPSTACTPPRPETENCTQESLPKVCTTPGYVPNLTLCRCAHENWEM